MLKAVLLWAGCLALSPLLAQRTIKGRVVNESTGVVIPGSSIFITNTSKGTTADNNGRFELVDVPAGKHELVISSVGYETTVFPFSEGDLPLQLKVEMKVKVQELENVTIEPSVEEGWDKWGRTFMESFVGTTANASQCRIKNEKAIRFRYYKKTNRLRAYADEPLWLENRALGYTIRYQLEDFELNFKEQTLLFTGYSLFTEMGKEGKEPKDRWLRNRGKAYEGSVIHFMRSLYANRLKEDGFEVRRMQRIPNAEKQRVKNIYNTRTMNAGSGLIVMDAAPGGKTIHPDSMNYYSQVMRQKDYVEVYGRDLLTADSLIVFRGDGFKRIYFPDFLYITTRNIEEEGYVKKQFPVRAPTFQLSYVFLVNEEVIEIESNGNYYNPRNFFTSAYWGWSEKMANSLPLDYRPGKP